MGIEYAHPLHQQHLVDRSEDIELTTSVNISTSSIAFLEKIYDSLPLNGNQPSFSAHESLETYIGDEQLFFTFKGQQIHVLNQLAIIIARETKRYYSQLNNVSKNGKFPIRLEFTDKIIQSYFPDEEAAFLTGIARLINRRLEEYPNIKHTDIDLNNVDRISFDPKQRKIKILDSLQLTYDVWNDWRYNQEFTIKKGIVKNSKKEPDANYSLKVTKEIERCRNIWEDKFQGSEDEIKWAAIEVMTNWRLLLGDTIVFEQEDRDKKHVFDPSHPHLISLLLDLDNSVMFERLINVRYKVDLSEVYSDTHDTVLGALLSGQSDIIVTLPQGQPIRTVMIDLKSRVLEINHLETLLTKFQGWASTTIKPGGKWAQEVTKSDLEKNEYNLASQINDIPLYHVNTSQVLHFNGALPDFDFMEQFPFNIRESIVKLQAIVELAAQRYEDLFKPHVVRSKNRNRVPVKHTLKERPEFTKRDILPNTSKFFKIFFESQFAIIEDFFDTGNPECLSNQLPLEGMENVAVRIIPKKFKKRLKKKWEEDRS